jgi:hypothetical protein
MNTTRLTLTHPVSRLALALALTAAAPLAAHAESDFAAANNGALSANARLDFRITIPKVLFLQVGTGSALADNTTIDLVDFTVTGANLGNGPVAAGGGAVTARLLSNGGNVTLQSATGGALSNGTDSISFSQISAAVSALSSATPLAHPGLADSGTSTTTITATNGIVSQDANWTFSFANSAIVPPGTYGGTATNGRVTYTASVL